MFGRIFLLTLVLLTFGLFSNARAATFTVDRTDDAAGANACAAAAGDCSLRGAMNNANSNGAGADTINFNVGGGNAQTINIVQALPEIATSLTIDGSTQPLWGGPPLIEINGLNAGGTANGFQVKTPLFTTIFLTVTFKSLIINRFSQAGIVFSANSGVNAKVVGCYIGTNAGGSIDLGNGGSGIRIFPNHDSTFEIGGTGAGERNVISGNGAHGVSITSALNLPNDNTQVEIVNNFIGTNAAGTADLGNELNGINMTGTGLGHSLQVGNGLANGRNLVSGNDKHGVEATSGTLLIVGNYIGAGFNGNADLGNTLDGIYLDEDVSSADIGGTVIGIGVGNVISGNNRNGILINNASIPAKIRRNFIGTNAAGTADLGNEEAGILLYEQDTFSNSSILIGSDTNAADGNTISGNDGDGIEISERVRQVKVFANKIGTNEAVTAKIPNAAVGIRVSSIANKIGAAGNDAAANVISGNGTQGILMAGAEAALNEIHNNYIGTNASGANLGNTGDGVYINQNANQNLVGDGTVGGGNDIAFNGNNGVQVAGGINNRIRGNSIYSNVELGIDLKGDGVTPNDAGDTDTGPNNLQNFPVLMNASPAQLAGTLNSAPNKPFTIDFYRVDSCDASGNGEGRYHLASKNITVINSGTVYFNYLDIPLTVGQIITATATNGDGNTSEFSQCYTVNPPPGVLSFSAATYSANEGAGTRTIVVNRTNGNYGTIQVNYHTDNQSATAGQDYGATSGTLIFLNGEVTKSFDVPISEDALDEADETVKLTLSFPTNGSYLVNPTTAVLTIVDNDAPPSVSVSDVSQSEGNSGTTNFVFNVQLSAASIQNVAVNFATLDGTANSPADYSATNGTVNFAAGETLKTVPVTVKGDAAPEANETFYVQLTNPTNATIADNQGVGLILDDDTIATAGIGGIIKKSDNTPLAGATVNLTGMINGQTTTDVNGAYNFQNLTSGGNYTVTPSVANYTFAPPNRQFTNLTSAVSNADFTATYTFPREVVMFSGITTPGQNGSVTTELVAQGNENKVAFSLSYDAAILSNPQVTLLQDAQTANALLTVNNSMSGKVGISLTLPNGQTFAAGNRTLVVVTFNTMPTNAPNTPINFGDAPTTREVLDVNSAILTSGYVSGVISFEQGFEADVAPRPTGTGNGSVTVADFTQVGKFVAGLDQINSQSNEFQRADSAPKATKGGGTLTVSDYTQAGRFAAGLDPVQSAGGAAQASKPALESAFATADGEKAGKAVLALPRVIRVVNTSTSVGQQVLVSIEVDTVGDENAFGFTLNYDQTKLGNPLVSLGTGAQGATLLPNTLQTGKVGVVVAFPTGQTIQAGTKQLVTISFDVAANAPGGQTFLTFADAPVFREVVNANADVLETTFTDGAVTILGPTGAQVTVGGRVTSSDGRGIGKVVLSLTGQDGETRIARTNPFGYYRFEEIRAGETVIVTARSKRYTFVNPTQVLVVNDDLDTVNFVGEP